MSSRLINVRLDSERVRKARALQERGVKLSDVVREAIDVEFLRLRTGPQPHAKALIRSIFERYPDSPDLPARDYDVHDRISARRAILRRLSPGK